MLGFAVHLLVIRIFIYCMGLVGTVFLILSIIQTKFSWIKSFEMFLVELAVDNLEEILVVNVIIYDLVILQTSGSTMGTWPCRSLKFLTRLGEIASILFTILISNFHFQKLRDASKRVDLLIFLDSIRSAGGGE